MDSRLENNAQVKVARGKFNYRVECALCGKGRWYVDGNAALRFEEFHECK